MKRSGLENLNQLEEILHYRFRDQDLLTQAMTHRSWAHEQVSPRAQRDARNLHNEALEFLGDSILGLIVADYLFKAYPNASEGELSRMKHRLVSAPTLAKTSIELRLGDFVRFANLKPGALQVIRSYGVETCLLQHDTAVVTALLASPEWERVYADQTSAIFVRRSAGSVNASAQQPLSSNSAHP